MKALARIYTMHTVAQISYLKISIKNCLSFKSLFTKNIFWGLESACFTKKMLVLRCIDTDFCDQIRVGIGIWFEKKIEKKGHGERLKK